MYPTDPSISSYGSNPSTPVNSPPPLSSQPPCTPLATVGNGSGSSWQQLAPAVVGNNQSVINNIQSPIYQTDIVARGIHMVTDK